MNNKKLYSIEKTEEGMQIQKYLREAGFSKAQIRSMKFMEGGICLNGQRERVTAVLKAGDVLEVLLAMKEGASSHLLSLEKMPEILYEDEDVIAVNKPAGIAVHPSHGHYLDTLSNQLAYYFRMSGQRVEVHSIGRLDLETSGIVLFAKHRAAAARLSAQRETGVLQKQYLAICSGRFEQKSGCKRGAIAPVPGSLMKMCVSESGKRAVTYFEVEKQYAHAALVRLELKTGRTHQIRVHMADAGHPLLGDRLYGIRAEAQAETSAPRPGEGKQYGSQMQRAALHAGKMTFRQPFCEKEVTVTAPFPEDMQIRLEQLEDVLKNVLENRR